MTMPSPNNGCMMYHDNNTEKYFFFNNMFFYERRVGEDRNAMIGLLTRRPPSGHLPIFKATIQAQGQV